MTGKYVTTVDGEAIADIVTSPKKGTTVRRLILLLSTIFAGEALAASPHAVELRQITPMLSDAVLFNPGMGLYMAGGSGLGYKPGPDAWLLSACDIVYFRPTWNDLEATFETSLETAGGHLALERGSNDTATRIDLWLDNVQLISCQSLSIRELAKLDYTQVYILQRTRHLQINSTGKRVVWLNQFIQLHIVYLFCQYW